MTKRGGQKSASLASCSARSFIGAARLNQSRLRLRAMHSIEMPSAIYLQHTFDILRQQHLILLSNYGATYFFISEKFLDRECLQVADRPNRGATG
jgi:hypothetical protein